MSARPLPNFALHPLKSFPSHFHTSTVPVPLNLPFPQHSLSRLAALTAIGSPTWPAPVRTKSGPPSGVVYISLLVLFSHEQPDEVYTTSVGQIFF